MYQLKDEQIELLDAAKAIFDVNWIFVQKIRVERRREREKAHEQIDARNRVQSSEVTVRQKKKKIAWRGGDERAVASFTRFRRRSLDKGQPDCRRDLCTNLDRLRPLTL